MHEKLKQSRLLSHALVVEEIDTIVDKIKTKLREQGQIQYVAIVDELAQFDFGRYLLQNQGINGYWTHYMLTHPRFGRQTGKNNRGDALHQLESYLLDRAPLVLATQQRFEIFMKENQKVVANGVTLACIPCGMMGELFYLNFDNVDQINLIGIDYDADALKDAEYLAKEKGLSSFIKLMQQDAWQLQFENEFDLISSNGLTIYEPDDTKVTELYREFHHALKSGGKLVTSFVTPPPMLTDNCEWDFSQIDQEDLLFQKIIFADILSAKWQCFRSTEKTRRQLESVGFTKIEFIYDTAKMFPTVVSYKA